jgi:hypothetical protein
MPAPNPFRPMDVIRCDNPGTYNLTRGRHYTVVRAEEMYVHIENDLGSVKPYGHHRFSLVERYVPPPPPPPPPDATAWKVKAKSTRYNGIGLEVI